LAQFQAAKAEAPDTLELMESINIAQGEGALTAANIKSAFDMWWPKLKTQLNEIEQQPISTTKQKKRTEIELLEEILEIVRQLSREPQKLPTEMGLSTIMSRARLQELLDPSAAREEALNALVPGRIKKKKKDEQD
jgi:hypothetical protein